MTWSDIPGDDPTNAAMIKRDEPVAVPAVAAGEDPLLKVRSAVVTALYATRRGGSKDSDLAHREAYILDEVRRLLASRPVEPAQVLADASIPQGLMAEHRPGDRWSVTP